MQYKAYSRQNINLVDSGAVRAWEIDSDYLVMNNTTVSLVRPTEAIQGDFIALIKTSGAYSLGCITAVDNKALTITYKDCKEVFNDNILNPFITDYIDDKDYKFRYDAVNAIATLLNGYNIPDDANEPYDPYSRLKIQTQTSGVYDKAVWDYSENGINVTQYLIDCFDRYNIVLQFSIAFGGNILYNNGIPYTDNYLVINIMYNQNEGALIMDNIKLQTLDFSEEQNYVATVCIVLDENKIETSRWYLRTDNTVTDNKNDTERALPVQTVIAEYKPNDDDPDYTEKTLAESTLINKTYNHYIESSVNRDTKMFDIERYKIGDKVKIVYAPIVEPINDSDPTSTIIETIYTGYKESSKSSVVKLMFGKARINYTDLIQLKFRKGATR